MAVSFDTSYAPPAYGGFSGLPRVRSNYGPELTVDPGALAAAAEAAGTPGLRDQLRGMFKGGLRKAGEAPSSWMKALGTPKNLLRAGGVAAVVPAVMELADDSRPIDERGARAGGSLLGIPAAAAGLALGGGATPLGLALAALFGYAGSQAGATGAEGVLGLLKGSETDQATRQFLKQQDALTQAKVNDALRMLPVQRQQAALALENQRSQSAIANDELLNRTMASALLNGQINSGNLFNTIVSS